MLTSRLAYKRHLCTSSWQKQVQLCAAGSGWANSTGPSCFMDTVSNSLKSDSSVCWDVSRCYRTTHSKHKPAFTRVCAGFTRKWQVSTYFLNLCKFYAGPWLALSQLWCHMMLHSVASYLEARQIWGLEVVGRAAAPVHDVLVLALTSQFAVPVGEPQVVVHHGLAVGAVLQHGVEKGLEEGEVRVSVIIVWLFYAFNAEKNQNLILPFDLSNI